MKGKRLSKFLKTYAPDFCFVSMYDLLLMAEQEPELENVTFEVFNVTVSNLYKKGIFERKKDPWVKIHGPRHIDGRCIKYSGYLYRRIK